ncbi:hypothetical protein BMW24_013830 [Mycobacterium heckeshornense]|uniref:Uncharacterized protein n=1 Tax=Mycobacterium heckeshornense TaxID=110505 RepID=A0A2G8B8H2_9MYCO|nr:hypothetical protein [Mycobacterium heckeshornense]MCV7033290.1 hypothetical protein [Mycobacterium heckeshornense]PIJ34040.1 hypothetical protein BMW24_013830 [Mycobacterium heckeshornense]BCO37436.1 hypothetical protein MHEC_38690 [Mycobacterium heckeshornense]
MLATVELPTLSQIRAWDTDHLIEAADHWTATADRWDDAFWQVWNQSASMNWEGQAQDALLNRTTADKATASGKSDQLREASGIARRGAGDIDAAKRRVLYAVEDAHNAGFSVGEDLSVTDTRRSRTAAELAARQAQAQQFAADLRSRAAELVGVDHEVAGNLANAAVGIGNTTFNEQPIHSGPDDKIINDGDADRRYGVRLVDNTFKQDGPTPSPTPTPAPPPAPDLGPIQRQLQDQQKQINDIQQQLHKPSEPTLGGLGVAFGTGCAGGALATSETGPGAIAGCAVLGGLSGIGYILGKIWE